MDVVKIFENVNVATLSSDANFKVIYQNERCRQLFNKELGRSNYVGADLSECHEPETTEIIEGYFKEYKEKKRLLDHYIMEEPDHNVTVVNVPIYTGGEFAGIVEFIFESSLA